jgi:DNA-binding SARP family transcriptional activator/tetratricopeptide (TPR) repeat protein
MAVGSLQTLGGLQLSIGDVGVPAPTTSKARALLAYLILGRTSAQARERIADVFWPDFNPENARANLSTSLHSLRRCLRSAAIDPDACITADKTSIRWIADTSVDVEALEVFEADPNASPTAENLFSLYRGEFLEGIYEEWVVAQRERYAALFERLLTKSLKATPDISVARELVARNAYDEQAFCVLIDADIAAGRRVAAARLIHRYRAALAEFGERPSRDFEGRYGQIATHPVEDTELRLAFAGRERELALLDRALSDASARQGSFTVVCGEPGIGKTTLLKRVADRAATSGLRVVTVRCVAGDPRPLGPWGDLFEELTGERPAELSTAGRQRVVDVLATRIVASLGGPSAILIDDGQWLASEALETFVNIVGLGVAGPHAIVCAVRPEGVPALEGLHSRTRAQEIRLAAMSSDELSEVFRSSAVDAPTGFVQRIHDRTGGQPLYVSHIVTSLARSGSIRRDGSGWRVDDTNGTAVTVPESLARVLEARLREGGKAAAALAFALAIEPTATLDDLVAVLGIDEAAVMDGLDVLLTLGILEQKHSESNFSFAHDLVREIALRLQNRARRTAVHRAFAQRCEARAASDDVLRRARHLEEAGDLLPAAEAFIAAAVVAYEWHAPAAALERCDAAIRLAGSMEDAPRTHRVSSKAYRLRASIFGHANDMPRALDSVSLAVQHARLTEDGRFLAEALWQRASAYTMVNDAKRALADATAVVAIGHTLGDNTFLVQGYEKMAYAYLMLGDAAQSLDSARKSLDVARRGDSAEQLTTSLIILIQAQFTYWDFSGVLASADACVDTSHALGKQAVASALLVRAMLTYALGDYDRTEADVRTVESLLEALKAGTERQRRWGMPTTHIEIYSAYYAALVAAARERWDEAIAHAGRVIDRIDPADQPMLANAIRLVTIDSLLGRNFSGDVDLVGTLVAELAPVDGVQTSEGWSDCPELARAHHAARAHLPDTLLLLKRAFDALESNAAVTPLLSDWAFFRLADAAREAGASALDVRCRARGEELRARRLQAIESSTKVDAVDGVVEATRISL